MGKGIIIGTTVIVVLIIIITIIFIYRNKVKKALKEHIEELDREKNLIESAPINSELSKLETIIKNDKIEEKYNEWQERFEIIKKDNIEKINDMLIDLDFTGEKINHNDYMHKTADAEIEIAKAKKLTDTLLEEIREITLSEEKYRSIIIKLKTKYRELNNTFESHKKEYGEIKDIIELQFENIEKRFQDFEEHMEKNEYNEVVHIVKAIDSMVDHMDIIITEVPDLMLLSCKLIPKRIDQINEVYDDMISKEYPLDYLKIPYNLEESKKKINDILDRIRVLNLEDCMFELRTILEYLDSLFNEFENEKNSKKIFEENKVIFEEKLDKINKVVNDIYGQLDEIKNMYDLKDEDVTTIDNVNIKLIELNKRYKTSLEKLKNMELPYSEIVNSLEVMSNDLNSIDEELDVALKSLGNMYDDEVRAREQLDEIQELLKQAKLKIRGYKLPLITNNYFVQLSEANDAIHEIIKELDKKPIVIKTLNTRVDTARDLVLKFFKTNNETIKFAKMSEMAIVYGNRFRSSYADVDQALNQAEIFFYKGNYRKSLEISIKVIDNIDDTFSQKLESFYEKEI